jgi:GH35 family endo-1,4-beta-xylanase
MVTELDVAIPMDQDEPRDPSDLYRQAQVYRAVVKYAIHFGRRCQALMVWGFTDRTVGFRTFPSIRKVWLYH